MQHNIIFSLSLCGKYPFFSKSSSVGIISKFVEVYFLRLWNILTRTTDNIMTVLRVQYIMAFHPKQFTVCARLPMMSKYLLELYLLPALMCNVQSIFNQYLIKLCRWGVGLIDTCDKSATSKRRNTNMDI